MLGDALMLLFLYGWLAVWPFARLVLRRTGTAVTVLQWTFIVGFVLEAAGHLYVWDLHRSGNRDWWMAWAIPQLVAALAWLTSFVAFVALLAVANSKAHRYP